MENKPKKCNGIGKANGFIGCGKEVVKRTFGLCSVCFYEFLTTDERGKIIYQKSFLPKVSLKLKSFEKATKQKLKENTTNYKNKLQTEVNKIVRLIDKDLPCLARNQKGQMHAGHVFARGGNQTIRYNLHNIHRQSAQSNHWQNDDGLLRDGIINEYGSAYMDFIASLRQTPQIKYSDAELKDIVLKASKIVLQLKKLDKTYNLTERIALRNYINIELGIYDKQFCIYE